MPLILTAAVRARTYHDNFIRQYYGFPPPADRQ